MRARVAVTCGKPERAKRYAEALSAIGLEPVVVAPPEQRTLAQMEIQGLLLSGGTDVDPALYSQERQPESQEPDCPRDRLEARMLREALQRDIPVLGICRGMQFLNVYHGGTLHQHHDHQAAHFCRTPDPSLPAHAVTVQPGTRLAAILGDGRCEVNSRHHQAAARVPYQLAISARTAGGMVEGLERKDKTFVVAVQWHPEDMLNDSRQRKLFEAFGDLLFRRSGADY